jgi:AcrR family transcriptional regulator
VSPAARTGSKHVASTTGGEPGGRRRRRSVEDARREILDAAERLLEEGGPDAVRVQTVARAVGVTDAAVHYHFGSRDELLESLIRDVGRRMKADLAELMLGLDGADVDLGALLDLLDETYRVRGYARLTAWMRLTGWRPKGSGMFRTHAEALHDGRGRRAASAGRTAPPLDDSLHLFTLLNLVTWADPLVGAEWRRSVGLPSTPQAAARFREWLVALLQQHLELEHERGRNDDAKRPVGSS